MRSPKSWAGCSQLTEATVRVGLTGLDGSDVDRLSVGVLFLLLVMAMAGLVGGIH